MASNVRFMVKLGVSETLQATFDTSNLPGQTLTGLTITWFVKKFLSQGVLIQKVSTDVSQIEIQTPGDPSSPIGVVWVYLTPSDTSGLTSGDYYWAFTLSNGADIFTISPPTSHGELILLDSAVG